MKSELEKKLYNFIIRDQEDYNNDDVMAFLKPFDFLILNRNFRMRIENIVSLLFRDRDGNGVINLDDLKVLTEDKFAFFNLILSIFLMYQNIPKDLKKIINFDQIKFEEFVYKFMGYIFLIELPLRLDNKLSIEEKKFLLELMSEIYELETNFHYVEKAAEEVSNWFKTGKWKNLFLCCTCFSCVRKIENEKDDKVDRKLSKISQKIQLSQENFVMKKKVQKIEKELKLIKKKQRKSQFK